MILNSILVQVLFYSHGKACNFIEGLIEDEQVDAPPIAVADISSKKEKVKEKVKEKDKDIKEYFKISYQRHLNDIYRGTLKNLANIEIKGNYFSSQGRDSVLLTQYFENRDYEGLLKPDAQFRYFLGEIMILNEKFDALTQQMPKSFIIYPVRQAWASEKALESVRRVESWLPLGNPKRIGVLSAKDSKGNIVGNNLPCNASDPSGLLYFRFSPSDSIMAKEIRDGVTFTDVAQKYARELDRTYHENGSMDQSFVKNERTALVALFRVHKGPMPPESSKRYPPKTIKMEKKKIIRVFEGSLRMLTPPFAYNLGYTDASPVTDYYLYDPVRLTAFIKKTSKAKIPRDELALYANSR